MNKMLVAICDSETAANAGLKALRRLSAEGDITLYAVGVLLKDEKGHVSVKKPMDQGPLGMGVGLAVGSLIGLLGGPAGLVVGAVAGVKQRVDSLKQEGDAKAVSLRAQIGHVTGDVKSRIEDRFDRVKHSYHLRGAALSQAWTLTQEALAV